VRRSASNASIDALRRCERAVRWSEPHRRGAAISAFDAERRTRSNPLTGFPMRTLLVLCLLAAFTRAADLSVGFAEADVTPKLDAKKPVFIAGFGHNRKATKVHDPIMARAVVLSDGKQKIALVSVDVVGLFNSVAESVRKQVDGFAYVCVSSTHNHEGPDTLGL